MESVEVLQVIRTNLRHRGDGSEKDPNRFITQYWSMDGELLVEVDAWADSKPDVPEFLPRSPTRGPLP